MIELLCTGHNKNGARVGKVTEGFEYKWVQDGSTYRVRIHGADASAPDGSNAANGWVVRVQQGKKYLDPISLEFQPPGITVRMKKVIWYLKQCIMLSLRL